MSIHEARNLEGVDCNPLLRVACKCGQQVKKTKSSKGSINPKFNEVSIKHFCCPCKIKGWIHGRLMRWYKFTTGIGARVYVKRAAKANYNCTLILFQGEVQREGHKLSWIEHELVVILVWGKIFLNFFRFIII